MKFEKDPNKMKGKYKGMKRKSKDMKNKIKGHVNL